MKSLVLFVLICIIHYVICFQTCSPPNVSKPYFPLQYLYNHGESISVGYPHEYFLRC